MFYSVGAEIYLHIAPATVDVKIYVSPSIYRTPSEAWQNC